MLEERKIRMFSDDSVGAPLRQKVFRRIWLASLLSNFGSLIQGVGAAWAMTQMTTSADMVALVQTASMLPIMLISIPAAAYFAAHDRRHFASVVFMYLMMLMTGSRSGLIFGTTMLLLCFAYVYHCNPERRAVYRRVGLISLVPAVALLIALVPRLFASRMVDGALISPDDSRYTFFIQGLLDFVKNPLFGCGLGSMHNAPIFLGVEGSIVWYHNLIAQILGSMGLVGVVGYGWLFYDRVRLLWRKRSRTTMAFALSYFAMLLISMTNPGMFCPMPNALLMVAMFVVVERQPDTAAAPVKAGIASAPERRLF